MSAVGIAVGVLAAGSLFVASGCKERVKPSSSPRIAPVTAPRAVGGGPPPTEMAIDQLGSARCEKEARCGRIGPEGSYNTRQQCVDSELLSRFDALDPSNCPNGIRADRFGACLEAYRAERCDDDSLTRDCTLQALCAP